MKEGLTKKESAFLKGLALWMMIYHHRFIDQVWLWDPDYQNNFTFLLGDEFTRVVAWFCKIALSLMTFVSGYGICYVFRRNKENRCISKLGVNYKSVIKRLIPFYGHYWYAFIIWTLADFVVMKIPLHMGEYLLNASGLSYSLNGSWWYVLQYVEMMLLAPVMDIYLTRFDKKTDIIKWIIPVLVAVAIIVIPNGRTYLAYFIDFSKFQISYMAIFVVGYIVARWNIFGIIRTWLSKRNVFIHYGICLVGLVGIMVLRIKLSTFPAYCRTDFIIAPIWILCLCELLTFVPAIVNFFGWFSKYSMYIWVLHLIFMYSIFYPITMATGLAFMNYLTIVLLVTIASLILAFMEKEAFKIIRKKFPAKNKN